MLINGETLDLVFRGFKATYTDAYFAAPTHGDKIAMTVPSSGREETYGWMGQFPNMREWVGPRHVKSLAAHGFTIRNKTFEATVEVSRNDISDDKLGIYKPAFSEMGQSAKRHPEELIFGLLASGFNSTCYDGQNFFDTDHPVLGEDGEASSVSNMQTGTGPAWYLLDVSRGVRPIIWQEREQYEFTQITRADDHHVFMNDRYLYGIRARGNAGFGLWQLAHMVEKTNLTKAALAKVVKEMKELKTDGGYDLKIRPSLLVVPPALEETAREILEQTIQDGTTNIWAGRLKLHVEYGL